MKQLTWNSFTKKIYINSDIEKLFWCWSTQEGICSWFLKNTIYERNGKKISSQTTIQSEDLYTWMWHNWDGQEEGKIIDVRKNEFVKFTFAGNCEVLVSFKQKDNTVLVSLTQSNIPLDEKSKLEIFYGCSNGWTFWLANLKPEFDYSLGFRPSINGEFPLKMIK